MQPMTSYPVSVHLYLKHPIYLAVISLLASSVVIAQHCVTQRYPYTDVLIINN